MAIKIAGYDPDRLFAKNDKVLGYDRKIVQNDFKQLYGKEVVLQCANSILSTPRGARLKDCSFGSELYKYVYSPSDEETAQAIREEIVRSFEEQDERLKVKFVNVLFHGANKGFTVNVSLTLPSGKPYNTQVVITPETFSFLKAVED